MIELCGIRKKVLKQIQCWVAKKVGGCISIAQNLILVSYYKTAMIRIKVWLTKEISYERKNKKTFRMF